MSSLIDGRRNNGGHSPKGAGRKPASLEVNVIAQLDRYVDGDEVAIRLNELITNDETTERTRLEAIKLYMGYRYGKPRETKDINLSQEPPLFVLDIEATEVD